MHLITTVLAVGGLIMLALAAALTLVRMSRGPSTLDRVVAADVMIAIVVAGLAVEAVLNRHSTTLPVMLVLSLVGFAGSLSVARFAADRDKARKWNTAETPGQDGPRWVAPAERDLSSRPDERDPEDRNGS